MSQASDDVGSSFGPNMGPPALLGRSVCYIVAAVIFNETRKKILMVQEAKSSCFQQWYLPAGKVEPNETLCSAVCREAREEADVIIEPSTITFVEMQTRSWMRFTFAAEILKGKPKTIPDEESLQAAWLDLDLVMAGGSDEYKLRSSDVESCIRATLRFTTPEMRRSWFLPKEITFSHISVSLLIVRYKPSTQIVVHSQTAELPSCDVPRQVSPFMVLKNLFSLIFPNKEFKASDLSVVAVEHCGQRLRPNTHSDGIRIVMLVDPGDYGHGDLNSKVNFMWTMGKVCSSVDSEALADPKFTGCGLVFM